MRTDATLFSSAASSPSVSRREGTLSVVLSTANRCSAGACCASSYKCVCVCQDDQPSSAWPASSILTILQRRVQTQGRQTQFFPYQPSMSVLLFLSRKEDRWEYWLGGGNIIIGILQQPRTAPIPWRRSEQERTLVAEVPGQIRDDACRADSPLIPSMVTGHLPHGQSAR